MARVGGLDVGKDAYKSWFNDVLKSYLHMQRARTKLHQTPKKTRLTLFHPPNPPLSKYLASAFWAVLNRWLDASEREVEEKKRRGRVAGQALPLLKSCWRLLGRLIACLGCDMKRADKPNYYQDGIALAEHVCVWVSTLWCVGQAGNYDNAKVCQVANHKEYTISNAVPERRITYGSSFSGI